MWQHLLHLPRDHVICQQAHIIVSCHIVIIPPSPCNIPKGPCLVVLYKNACINISDTHKNHWPHLTLTDAGAWRLNLVNRVNLEILGFIYKYISTFLITVTGEGRYIWYFSLISWRRIWNMNNNGTQGFWIGICYYDKKKMFIFPQNWTALA